EGVVDRAALEFVRPDCQPYAVRACDLGEPIGVRTGNRDRLLREPREDITGVARVTCAPAREIAHPAVGRIDRDERFREECEPRARAGDLGHGPLELVDRRLTFALNWFGLIT